MLVLEDMNKFRGRGNALALVDGEVGIEIEMEGRGVADIYHPKMWKPTHDGSLRGESIEWVLRAPVARGEVDDHLQALGNALSEARATWDESERCGVHVHINCQQMTIRQVINFAVLYFIVEDILTRFCGEHREGNLFCLRARDAEELIQVLARCSRNGTMIPMQEDAYRYSAINMTSLQKYGSIEFRALPTPKDLRTISIWTKLLLRIKDKSLLYEEAKHMVEGLSQIGPLAFIRSIFGDTLVKHLDLTDAEELLMEGVRRVQDVAYTKFKDIKSPKQVEEDQLRPDDLDPPDAFGRVRWHRMEIPDPPRPAAVRRQMKALKLAINFPPAAVFDDGEAEEQ